MSELLLLRVHPSIIEEFAERIRPGLEKVIHRCKADFIVEDVLRELANGNVHLHLIELEGKDIGFSIMSDGKDRYSGKIVLTLDMTYVTPGHNALPLLRDAIDNYAASLGVDRIEWFSPRRGWDSKLTEIGYTADSITFVREVPHG